MDRSSICGVTRTLSEPVTTPRVMHIHCRCEEDAHHEGDHRCGICSGYWKPVSLLQALKALETADGNEVLRMDVCERNVHESPADQEYVNRALFHGFRVVASLLGAEPSAINHVVDPPVWDDAQKPTPFFRGDENWVDSDLPETTGYHLEFTAYQFDGGKVVAICEDGLSVCWSYCWVA